MGAVTLPDSPLIPVAVSARHVHLSTATLSALFGADYHLRPRAQLSQPGQFAAEETVALIGPAGRLDDVRIVGPPRTADQVEISLSDEHLLGVSAPIRLSGELGSTPGIVLQGPRGSLTVPHGVICALRHIHMSPEEARRLKLSDRQIVAVSVGSPERRVIFTDVAVRVSENYRLELHLDTDEANAAGVTPGMQAALIL